MATETQTDATPEDEDERIAGLGRFVTTAGDGHETVPVEAPFTGETIGTIPQCERADVQEAAERAREGQAEWAATPVDDRADVMLTLHDLVLDRQDELLDVMQLESGKARIDGHEEVLDLATTARHYAHRAGSYLSRERRSGAFPVITRTEVNHWPVGIVGAIAPWNYPLVLTMSEMVPALLAGNAVIVKPAEQTPFTALLGKDLLIEAGLPPDCMQIVTGHGDPIGEPLIEEIDYFSFTGSSEVGRSVAAMAAERLVDFSLELGGKNAAIVLEDADLKNTVDGLIRGCFPNAGQQCISFERVYVQEAIYDEFLESFVAATEALELGPDLDYGVDIGSLISERQLEKVKNHVDDAREKGATVETGGEARPDVGPYFFEPTVLTGVTDEMTAKDVETFGPVTRIEPFEDVEDAVERANDTPYGLNGSVWTGDTARGREIARQIEAGTVGVNDSYTATWGSMDAPMGGMKDSGIGRRHGKEGFYKYTEPQTVATQRFLPTGPMGDQTYEEYGANVERLLRLFKNIPGLR